jgi:hypothetical protein
MVSGICATSWRRRETCGGGEGGRGGGETVGHRECAGASEGLSSLLLAGTAPRHARRARRKHVQITPRTCVAAARARVPRRDPPTHLRLPGLGARGRKALAAVLLCLLLLRKGAVEVAVAGGVVLEAARNVQRRRLVGDVAVEEVPREGKMGRRGHPDDTISQRTTSPRSCALASVGGPAGGAFGWRQYSGSRDVSSTVQWRVDKGRSVCVSRPRWRHGGLTTPPSRRPSPDSPSRPLPLLPPLLPGQSWWQSP